MITEVISKKQVEDALADGGNFTKVRLAVLAENFFEYRRFKPDNQECVNECA